MHVYKTFFFRSYPEYLSFAAGFLEDRVAARKVTLEAFFLLWDRYAEFDNEARVKAFLYLTIRNKCFQAMRDLPGLVVGLPPKEGTGHVDPTVVPAFPPADASDSPPVDASASLPVDAPASLPVDAPASLPADLLRDILAYAGTG